MRASSNIKRNVYRNITALNSRNLCYLFQTVEDSDFSTAQLASIWKTQEARFQELELKIQGKVKTFVNSELVLESKAKSN